VRQNGASQKEHPTGMLLLQEGLSRQAQRFSAWRLTVNGEGTGVKMPVPSYFWQEGLQKNS
jgi:hypothetical protein